MCLLALLLAAAAALALVRLQGPEPLPERVARRVTARRTVADRVLEHGTDARARLVPFFRRAGVSYPPGRFVLAAFKRERELHLFAAAAAEQPMAFIRAYPILAASGALGPKLRAGDEQVPEGVYRIDALNPNSQFHLSLRLGYPNAHDQARAREDGRTNLGGDIMIHGDAVSIGCLAIGDVAAEELFVLAADAGWQGARVILSPVDFRRAELPRGFRARVPWTRTLYADLRRELAPLPLPSRR